MGILKPYTQHSRELQCRTYNYFYKTIDSNVCTYNKNPVCVGEFEKEIKKKILSTYTTRRYMSTVQEYILTEQRNILERIV